MENSKQIQMGLLALVAILLGLNLTGALDGLMGKSSDETSVRDAARANVTSETPTAPAPTNAAEPAVEVPTGPTTTIEFEESEFDFGTIDEGEKVSHTYKFTNTGSEPLIIKDAKGSCGCTVPTYPKEPIMPFESAQIEIRYATNRLGKFSKTVTLTTNEVGEKHVLKVQGEVLKPETESVPTTAPSIIGGGQ